MPKTLIQTVGVSIQGNQILVGNKSRGLAAGLLNFPGGNYDPNIDSDTDACLIREFREEIGVEVKEKRKLGIMTFRFAGKDFQVELHIYRIDNYSGTPRTIEGQDITNPRYLELNQELYDQMWAGDIQWLPRVIEGKLFRGSGVYETPRKLLEFNIEEVPSL